MCSKVLGADLGLPSRTAGSSRDQLCGENVTTRKLGWVIEYKAWDPKDDRRG